MERGTKTDVDGTGSCQTSSGQSVGVRRKAGHGRLPGKGTMSEKEKNKMNRGLFKGKLAAEGK